MGVLSPVLFQLRHYSPSHTSSPSDFLQLKNGSKKIKYLHHSDVELTVKILFILETNKQTNKVIKESPTRGRRVGSFRNRDLAAPISFY